MMHPPLFYAHATLCLLLGGLLAWQALRYPAGSRRWLRLVAGLVAAGALWLSIYPPQRTVSLNASDAAILLTDQYHPDSLRQLLLRLGPVPVLRYGAASGDTVALPALSSLKQKHPEVRRLHVLGLGIPEADLPALPTTVQLVAQPHALATGFTAGGWNRQLTLGDPLRVAGHFANPERAPVWLRLLAAGAVQDSVQLPTGSGSFELRFQPRRAGRLLARLEARRGTRRLAVEPVPAEVTPPQQLRLLLLAGTPSFELNLLKNHLAERGHQVAVRLSVSRGLYQREFLNRSATSLDRLTPALLSTSDVLIADAEALNALSAQEARTLATATTDGLGIVLFAAEQLPRSLPGRPDFALQPRPTDLANRPQQLKWADGQGQTTFSATLRPSRRLQALVTAGQPVTIAAAARRTGWGTVVVATPTSTYRWQLIGTPATYGAYWSQLLSAAARPFEARARWNVAAWPRLHEPTGLRLATAAPVRAAAEVLAAAQPPVSVALGQYPHQSANWLGQFWPMQPGWHSLRAPGLAEASFYVFDSREWLGVLRAQRQAAAAQVTARAYTKAAAPRQRRVAWPAGWFFALFVLAAGGLWLDEKRG